MIHASIPAPIEAPLSVEVGGASLEITPVRVGEIPALLRALGPAAEGLGGAEIDWLALLAAHGDGVLDAMAIAAHTTRAWIDALAMDEAVRLAGALLEVNADFFSRRLAPEISRVTERIGRVVPGGTPG